jgi:hypothetical protein
MQETAKKKHDDFEVAVAWKPITSIVIQNCFAKCGFGIEDAVVTEEDDQANNDWVEL